MDVAAWLTGIKPALAEYAPIFEEQGYDTVEDVQEMDDEE